jgi:hypothetical protein
VATKLRGPARALFQALDMLQNFGGLIVDGDEVEIIVDDAEVSAQYICPNGNNGRYVSVQLPLRPLGPPADSVKHD